MKKADTNFLPVVQRELREGARRPFNYWLRVGGASAGVWLLFVLSKRDEYHEQAAAGLHLFTNLHLMLLALIGLIVPAMSADCIAREKREGTLGLLFLTPLTAMGIVIGKGLVQVFRAFTLWVAVLPVLIIPCLSGGVTGGDIYSALTIEFCVTLLCLSAGILASSLAKARAVVFILAPCLGLVFLTVFSGLLGLGFFLQMPGSRQPLPLTGLVWTARSLITGESAGIALLPGPAGTRLAVFVPASVSVTSYPNSPNGSQYLNRPGFRPVAFVGRAYFAMSAGWGSYFSATATRNVWPSLLLQSLLTAR